MGTDVAVAKANLPAHLQGVVPEGTKEFSGGVQSGFPVLAYRGKVWRVKSRGEEQLYVNEDGDAIQTIEAVLIRSNEYLSKTFYEGKYSEGDTDKPRCWSSDGVKPDSDVPAKVNPVCEGCPMNAWGSRVSDEGKKMKACQDVRRTAVIFSHELQTIVSGEKTAEEADIMLLRIPPATLNPLKDYAERVLAPKGASPFMLYTKIGFDTSASYPKLTFKGSQWLSEAEFSVVSDLRESDAVKRVINTSAEHVEGGTTGEASDEASSESTAKTEAADPAPPETSQEVEDEIAPAAPARAAAVEEEAADDEIAPAADAPKPPQPKAEKPKKAKPEAAKSKPEPKPDVESPDADDGESIDNMLSSILE